MRYAVGVKNCGFGKLKKLYVVVSMGFNNLREGPERILAEGDIII